MRKTKSFGRVYWISIGAGWNWTKPPADEGEFVPVHQVMFTKPKKARAKKLKKP